MNSTGEVLLSLAALAMKGDLLCVRSRVELGADVDEPNERGTTALMFAAARGAGFMQEYLLSKGADVDAKRPDGVSALMIAAEAGQLACLKKLLEAGADARAVDVLDRTALMYCAKSKNPDVREADKLECARVLMSARVDVSAKDVYGDRAEDFAKAARNELVALALLAERERRELEVSSGLSRAGAKGLWI